MSAYYDKWPEKTVEETDPNDLSDAEWRRRELLLATDPDPGGRCCDSYPDCHCGDLAVNADVAKAGDWVCFTDADGVEMEGVVTGVYTAGDGTDMADGDLAIATADGPRDIMKEAVWKNEKRADQQ